MVGKYERLIGSIVATDMDFNQLDEFLKAQMKKKEARVAMCHVQDSPHDTRHTHRRFKGSIVIYGPAAICTP